MSIPDDLLPIAKQHMRVDFDDDDEIIKRYLAYAIASIENELGWTIEQADVVWSPVLIADVSRYPTPVQPVSDFVATVGPDDVSAAFELQSTSKVSPVWLVHTDGTAFPEGIAITLTAGFTADTLPPDIEAIVLQVAATYYEYRESVTALNLDPMPYWLRTLLDGLWIPRA